jgi:hypothetical protein
MLITGADTILHPSILEKSKNFLLNKPKLLTIHS